MCCRFLPKQWTKKSFGRVQFLFRLKHQLSSLRFVISHCNVVKNVTNGEYCVYFYICVTPLFTIDIIIIIWIRRNLLEMFKYMQSICVQSTLMARVVLKRNGNWRKNFRIRSTCYYRHIYRLFPFTHLHTCLNRMYPLLNIDRGTCRDT